MQWAAFRRGPVHATTTRLAASRVQGWSRGRGARQVCHLPCRARGCGPFATPAICHQGRSPWHIYMYIYRNRPLLMSRGLPAGGPRDARGRASTGASRVVVRGCMGACVHGCVRACVATWLCLCSCVCVRSCACVAVRAWAGGGGGGSGVPADADGAAPRMHAAQGETGGTGERLRPGGGVWRRGAAEAEVAAAPGRGPRAFVGRVPRECRNTGKMTAALMAAAPNGGCAPSPLSCGAVGVAQHRAVATVDPQRHRPPAGPPERLSVRIREQPVSGHARRAVGRRGCMPSFLATPTRG